MICHFYSFVQFYYIVAQNSNNSTDKNNIVLYNWEGADTAFCGRRPSAHEISNEIAGSKTSEINPVFLWKASKLATSPPNQVGFFQTQILKDVQTS